MYKIIKKNSKYDVFSVYKRYLNLFWVPVYFKTSKTNRFYDYNTLYDVLKYDIETPNQQSLSSIFQFYTYQKDLSKRSKIFIVKNLADFDYKFAEFLV